MISSLSILNKTFKSETRIFIKTNSLQDYLACCDEGVKKGKSFVKLERKLRLSADKTLNQGMTTVEGRLNGQNS